MEWPSFVKTCDAVCVSLTREEAGWQYISLTVRRLSRGNRLEDQTAAEEVGLVVLSGTISVESGAGRWEGLGKRTSVFDGLPAILYLPPETKFTMVAESDAEVARAGSLAEGGPEAYVIRPEEIVVETRGQGNAQRTIRHLLEADRPASHLFLVECITPSGNWSSYPPHKHDTHAYPSETYLEEIYYHRLKPPQGFGFQRVYTRNQAADEAIVIKDGTVVAVRAGYHPVAVAPGYDLYYLNVMAGPIREWRFTDDPDHAWVSKQWKSYGPKPSEF